MQAVYPVRYYGWLVLKSFAATAVAAAVYAVGRISLIRLEYLNQRLDVAQANFDGVLLGFWIVPMLWVGLIALALHDQRFRCRTCGRRLRMPVSEGNYGRLLLDRPGTEFVCPYGHGKLRVDVRVSAPEFAWLPYGDFWDEIMRPADRKRSDVQPHPTE